MTRTVDHTVFIEAPFDMVWTMTNDVLSWPSLFSEYAAVEVLERREDYTRFRLTTVPDLDGAVWSWVSERFHDRESRTTVAQRVETGPFQFMTIWWDYKESGAGVRLRWRQRFAMKPEAPLDEDRAAERLNCTTEVQMAHVKAGVEAAAGTRAAT